MSEKGNYVGLVAGVITIFTFITGIYSLPSIFGHASYPSGIFSKEYNRSFSVGVLILCQVAYYLSYYGILRSIFNRFFEREYWIFLRRKDFFSNVLLAGMRIVIYLWKRLFYRFLAH
jgi:hypothetical protein